LEALPGVEMNSTPVLNPFVGPRPLQSNDHLFGRATELLNLCDLLLAERVVLMYSPSGAGKTSLINAGLIEILRKEEDFRVLPAMRVNLWPSATSISGPNKYIHSVIDYLEAGLQNSDRLLPEHHLKLSLGEYLKRRPRSAEEGSIDSQYEMLIFDQFEEIVTLDPADREAKLEFFKQVGEALRDRNRWALFAMREDHIAEIGEYSHLIPTALATRFRLNLLQKTQAAEAITGTTKHAERIFDRAVVERLVKDLATVTVQGIENSQQVEGDSVEPVQLQVVCLRLWDRHVVTPLTVEDVTETGAVNEALEDFYAKAVNIASEKTQVPERGIRDWIENNLILIGSMRGQVAREINNTLGLTNTVIDTLIGSHLIRGERRRGIDWIEITHDRLIRPILDSNARWRIASLTPFQQHAALWAKEGLDGMLLSGEALLEAEAWSRTQDKLTQDEQDFLDACLMAQERMHDIDRKNIEIQEVNRVLQEKNAQIEKEKNRAKWAAWILVGFSCLMVLQTCLLNQTNSDLKSERIKSQIQQLITEARELSDGQYTKSLGYALSAYKLMKGYKESKSSSFQCHFVDWNPKILKIIAINTQGCKNDSEKFSTRVALIGALSAAPPAVKTLSGHRGSVRSMVFSPRGDIIASASFDGSIIFWDKNTGDKLWCSWGSCDDPSDQSKEQRLPVYAMAFSPDGKLMASGYADGVVRLWYIDKKKVNSIGGLTHSNNEVAFRNRKVASLAFSQDSTKLATGGWDKQLVIWDVKNPKKPQMLASTKNNKKSERHKSVVYAVKFMPDVIGSSVQVVSGDWKGDIRIWDLQMSVKGGQPALNMSEHLRFGDYSEPAVYGIALNHEGDMLAASGLEKIKENEWRSSVILWNRQGNKWGKVSGFNGVIDNYNRASPSSLDISPNNTPSMIAGGGLSKSAIVWEGLQKKTGAEYPKLEYQFPERIYAVASDPTNPDMFALGGMRTIYLIDRTKEPLPITKFLKLPSKMETPIKAPGEWQAVAVSNNGKVIAALRSGELFLWERDQKTAEWRAKPNPIKSSTNLGKASVSIAIDKDGQFVALGYKVKKQFTVAMWSTNDGQLVTEMNMPEPSFPEKLTLRLAFSPTENLLAIVNGDSIGLYSYVPTGLHLENETPHIESRDSTFISLAYSADGKRLATGDNKSTVTLWNMSDRKLKEDKQISLFDEDNALALAFHPEGKYLAIGSDKPDIMIFDVDTGLINKTLEPIHEVEINNLMYGRTSKQIVLISQDKEAKTQLWELSGNIYRPMRRSLLAGPKPLAAMDNSSSVLVTSTQNKLLAWELSEKALLNTACKTLHDGSVPENMADLCHSKNGEDYTTKQ
jgi:WD40 repeat protein